MNYLVYIEHSAENLQFFLWYKDYQTRFANATTSDMPLAPEWTREMEEEVLSRMQKEKQSRLRQEELGAEIFKGTDFEKATKNPDQAAATSGGGNPFNTPPRTPAGGNDSESLAPSNAVSNPSTYRSQASDAFAAAGAKTPCECRWKSPMSTVHDR